MTDRLTLADCYKYPEADVQFTTDDNTIQRGYVRAIQVHSDTELEIECFPISFYHKTVSDCKLILRDISQLTDKEKRHIHRDYLHDVATDEVNWISFGEVVLFCRTYSIVDFVNYLRKIGVDIDNFIASGKAVKDE